MKERPMQSCDKTAWIVLAAALAAGCSAMEPAMEACTTSSQCQDTFGYGHVCGAGGYCQRAAAHPRCTATQPADAFRNPEQSVIFGAIFNDALDSQQGRKKALLLALEEINDSGGLEGRELGVVLCDIDGSKDAQARYGDALDGEAAAVETATHLAQTLGVPAILGPSTSAQVEKAFVAVRDSETLMMTFSATSVSLTSLDPKTVDDSQPGLLWRSVPPDSLQATAIAGDMLGGKDRAVPTERLAILYQDGSYGQGLATSVHERFNAAAKPDTYARLITFGDSDQLAQAVTAVADDAKYSAVQEILFVSSAPTDYELFLAKVAANAKLDGKQIFVTDTAATQAVLNAAAITNKQALFGRLRGSRPVPLPQGQDTAYQAFSARFNKEHGVDPADYSFTSQTYDAAWLVFAGTAWSLLQEQRVSGPGIARGLRRVTGGKSVNIQASSWYQIVESFRAGQAVDLRGASGELDFDPATEEITAPIEIWVPAQQGQSWGVKARYTWTPPTGGQAP
jgi:branched-chain amino acid transport system substrate-binding protein